MNDKYNVKGYIFLKSNPKDKNKNKNNSNEKLNGTKRVHVYLFFNSRKMIQKKKIMKIARHQIIKTDT